VTAQQLAELGSAMEGIGDLLTRGERERRVETPLTLSDEKRTRRKRLGVELGEPHERIPVTREGQAHRHRTQKQSGHAPEYGHGGRSEQDVVVTESIVIYD
jgi:hypothetical protein